MEHPSSGSVLFRRAVPLSLAAFVLVACSGATTPDVWLDPGSSPAPANRDSGAGVRDASVNTGTTDASVNTGTTDASSGNDCEPEVEPNDTPAEANTLDPERCGSVSPDDPKDYLTFRLKPDTRFLRISFTGQVRLRVDVGNNKTTVLVPSDAPAVPFVLDEDYFIEVTALNGGAVDWRVEVIETP